MRDPFALDVYDEDCRYHCHHCKSGRESEERTSFGVYAGRWCDACWKTSGYRDAVDDSARFDSLDAGETLDCETVEEDREWSDRS
ncbi:MAG: hypothetical protein KGK07_16355 [Chloroflexota bacterium]|nr:hypothetical protein [Chloroflexota bacterium]